MSAVNTDLQKQRPRRVRSSARRHTRTASRRKAPWRAQLRTTPPRLLLPPSSALPQARCSRPCCLRLGAPAQRCVAGWSPLAKSARSSPSGRAAVLARSRLRQRAGLHAH